MDSKEEQLHPTSEASSGSSSLPPSFINTENEKFEETIDNKDAYDDNSEDIGKGGVSDDEVDGGYVSGKEEFEPALENPIWGGGPDEGNAGEVIEEGKSDGPSVEASGISTIKVETLQDSGVLVSGDDGEKCHKDAEGDKIVLVKDSEPISASTDDVHDMEKSEVSLDEGAIESGSKFQDGDAGKVFDEVATKKEDPDEKGETFNTKEVVIASETEELTAAALEESPVVGPGDVKLTPEGDSVVDSIHVDVAGPGVVIVGEREEQGDEKTEVVIAPEAEEVAAAVALEESPVVGPGDVKLTPEWDSVVDSIHVDVAGPVVVIVGEGEEQGDEKTELVIAPGAEEVAAAAALEESPMVGPGDVKLTPERDSVVDSIHVNVAGPGVAIVGEREEQGDKIAEALIPIELIGGTNETGDVAEIAVSSREAGLDQLISEHSTESTTDTTKQKLLQQENNGNVEEKDESNQAADSDLVNGIHRGIKKTDSVDKGESLDAENIVKKQEEGFEPNLENGIASKIDTDRKVFPADAVIESDKDVRVHGETVKNNGDKLDDGVSKWTDSGESEAVLEPQEVTELKEDQIEVDEDVEPVDSLSEGDTDGMIFGSSEAARKFIEELEQGSGAGSHAAADRSFDQTQGIDGQIVTDSEEEADTDDEGEKGLFDSAALAALLKAATGADTDGGSITITSQDGSRLFSVERPAGLGSSLRSLRPSPAPAPATRPSQNNLFGPLSFTVSRENEDNLNEEEKKKLENLQKIRVKFLRLVHRLGVSPEESVAAQVLYRLALLGGRQGTQTYSLDAAKRMALQLEEDNTDALDFSINILVLGKSGLGKSATINSIFGEDKSLIDAFETGTASVKQISGSVVGVKVRIIDTPGLKSSAMEQGFNRGVLSSVKSFTKKYPPDVVLYVDRLDAQNRDLNDLPLLRTITSALGPTIWRSAIVTLTHAASAPPDGPSGTPLSYEVFVTQRSHVVQQSIGHAVGDLRVMSPSLMNPVSLVENHPSCRKNRDGQKILPNGQSWRPQLLLLCYSMKILAEASSLSKPQEAFDHRKIFGFRARAPPLPYMLSSMLQSRAHPKLPSDQGGDSVDSDIDLDDFSDSDREEEDEYDQLPPFKPLKKSQMTKLSKEQRKAYFEEYEYRVKLLQKKQWKEELKRMREIKKKGKDSANDFALAEDEGDAGAAAPVAVPLPDMALPPSFDGDNPSHRYRFLEPTSQFLARPVLDTHGWDHDCGYDGVNLEHSLAIANRFPGVYTIQITKDKKDFSISLDSSIGAKHGENMSTMVGFDIQSMGKQLAYIMRGETKTNKWKKNKAAGGISVTFLGDNVVPGVKIEDQITLGKQYVLVGGAGAVRSQHDTAYGANFELQRRELDYPIGQVQSTFSMSVIKWKGDLALGFNTLAQFSVGRNSKVAVRAGINNKLSGQVTVRTSSSEHISLALAAIIPTAISIYRKLWPGASDKYSIY